MTWTVETVSSVDAEIDALPVKLRARLVRLLETVEKRRSAAGQIGTGQGRGRDRRIYVTVAETGCGPVCVREEVQRALATTRKRMKQVMP